LVHRAGQDGPLATYVLLAHLDQPIEPDLAGAAPRVPGPGSDVHPEASRAGLLRGVAIVVLRRHLQRQQRVRVLASDQQDGTVLALTRVVLVGDPGPNDLAGVRTSVVVTGPCRVEAPRPRRRPRRCRSG